MLRVNVVLGSQYTQYVSSERAAETRLLRAEGVRRTYNYRCAQFRAARSQAIKSFAVHHDRHEFVKADFAIPIQIELFYHRRPTLQLGTTARMYLWLTIPLRQDSRPAPLPLF